MIHIVSMSTQKHHKIKQNTKPNGIKVGNSLSRKVTVLPAQAVLIIISKSANKCKFVYLYHETRESGKQANILLLFNFYLNASMN
jgi:hypothetical protein